MKSQYRWLVLLSLVVFAASTSWGQVPTGTPPFGSYGGGPDILNLANLNDHLAISVLNKPGRGVPFTYTLGYDSSVWYPVTSGSVTNWQQVQYWGWAGQTQIATGYVTYRWTVGHCGSGINEVFYDKYYFLAYWDRFGVQHPINFRVDDNWQCPPTGDPYEKTLALTDGSGLTVYINSDPSAIVYPRLGGTINPPLQHGTGAATFTDSNGNQITVDANAHFTDTLGTTALTVAGTIPSPVTFSYTSPQNTTVSYTMKYNSYTVQTNFGCSGVNEYGPTNNSLVSEIDLPDGTKYTFTYEATPGHAGNVTGRLASVQLPTGGTISYAYTGANNVSVR